MAEVVTSTVTTTIKQESFSDNRISQVAHALKVLEIDILNAKLLETVDLTNCRPQVTSDQRVVFPDHTPDGGWYSPTSLFRAIITASPDPERADYVIAPYPQMDTATPIIDNGRVAIKEATPLSMSEADTATLVKQLDGQIALDGKRLTAADLKRVIDAYSKTYTRYETTNGQPMILTPHLQYIDSLLRQI